jgi:hypothetical protein
MDAKTLWFGSIGVMVAMVVYYHYHKENYTGIKHAMTKLRCEDRCNDMKDGDVDTCLRLCQNNFDMAVDGSKRCGTCM